MQYGDFSSVVQLGVGLHVGTALLEMYGEIGMATLGRSIDRTRSLFRAPEGERPPKELEDELDRLESDFQIFRIQLFQEYRWYVKVNSIIAVVLAAILVFIAFTAHHDVPIGYEWIPITFCAVSLLPAPTTLFSLWTDAIGKRSR